MKCEETNEISEKIEVTLLKMSVLVNKKVQFYFGLYD